MLPDVLESGRDVGRFRILLLFPSGPGHAEKWPQIFRTVLKILLAGGFNLDGPAEVRPNSGE
jgi:hypothetical protein